MPQYKGVRVTLLVEDEMLERFAREALLKLGFGRRELIVTPYPVGRGSAKQWVSQQYPTHVKQYRSKSNHQKIALLVGTDADELSVAGRRRQLDESLESAAIPSRTDADRIALWVPRWNIETWVLSLSGDEVDEETDHKHRAKNIDWSRVADEFVRQFHAAKRGENVNALLSLLIAYQETTRISA